MGTSIRIDIARQALELFGDDGACIRRYRISTALNGAGEGAGSECTPRGRHRIRAKIGGGMPMGTIFRGRRPTGEVWTAELAATQPGRDWILSRILWLCGEDRGKNRGRRDGVNVDSMQRYIYIHGTGDDQPMGVPRSHGCVRMRNREVMELFELVTVGARVWVG
jgi:lipoprotein-anchoring transpeptidase ErfK/SrfK